VLWLAQTLYYYPVMYVSGFGEDLVFDGTKRTSKVALLTGSDSPPPRAHVCRPLGSVEISNPGH